MSNQYGVVGNPVEHSLSPEIHARFAKATNRDMGYKKYFVEINAFESEIRLFQKKGFRGLNITLPFKERAHAMCDTLGPQAKLAKAVNTITFREDNSIHGDNTDGTGLVRDIEINHGFSLKDRRVLLVGAGGAARGAMGPIIGARPESLTLINRTDTKAAELALEFSRLTGFAIKSKSFHDLSEAHDCIINATSMGLTDAKWPLPGNLIKAETCCYDMVYGKDTPFLQWARHNRAALVLDGYGMLVEQAAEAFLLWWGVRPETKDILGGRI